MALYTSTYLKRLSATKSFSQKEILLSESKKTHTSFDIFLSHSFLDQDEVEGLYIELMNQGFSVYVDWIIDPQLDRNNVTKETAELVRNRMKLSKSLLLAVSSNVAMSRWMPWELGFIDGKTGRCAIVPVSKDNITPKTFKRAEYLLLYPYLKRGMISYREDSYITETAYSYVSLNDWVRNRLNPTYKDKNIDEL
jgi:hypothetical protein